MPFIGISVCLGGSKTGLLNKNMLKVLINAYAVSPNWGSEPGLGWNWIVNLAKHCKLYVITEGEWKNEIEETLAQARSNDGIANSSISKEQADNMHFYYIPVSPRIRKMCWNQGDWRFYIYYSLWQRRALSLARKICKSEGVDITHQLNMIGFREPGLLWKIKDVPHVWGPIGSMGSVPVHLLADLPFSSRLKCVVKNCITGIQIKFGRVRRAINNVDVMVAALDVTRDRIKSIYGKDIPVLNETGLHQTDYEAHPLRRNGPLELLWVGRFIPTKQLGIALQALAGASDPKNFRLNIVGGEGQEQEKYQNLANQLGIADQCVWYGKIPNAQVQSLMRKSDLFVFTSIFEGGPHVILESISNRLPIVCFDTCGQGVVTDASIGFKVPLTTLEEGVKGFAKVLDYVAEHREVLPELSANCGAKQEELSWGSKVRYMLGIYQSLVK